MTVVPIEEHLPGKDGVEGGGEREPPEDELVVHLGEGREDAGKTAEKGCEWKGGGSWRQSGRCQGKRGRGREVWKGKGKRQKLGTNR